jgi:hypothetical protein
LCGCESQTFSRSQSEAQMFGPSTMRIHPAFTQVKDWTGDGKPDGIEAFLELSDQFGEPTRATGTIRFELYNFHESEEERRGKQLATPWTFVLDTRDQQIAHWNPVERAYTFRLPYDKISANRRYVLTAQFDRPGGRLFDQLIIEPEDKDKVKNERRAERAPTHSAGHGR